MIKQSTVPPLFRPDIPENRLKFLQDLSESLRGLMLPQTFRQNDGGVLEIMALGPLVMVRYEGDALSVPLPFQPDGDAPLACYPSLVIGRIKADKKTLEFGSADRRAASGWCISRGSEFKGGE